MSGDHTERMTSAEYRASLGQSGPPPAPRDQPERRLQIEVVDWLHGCTLTSFGHEVVWSHLANERRDRGDALLQHRMGVRAGLPDLLFWVFPGGVINIELKDPGGGRLSPEQREFLRLVEQLAHCYYVARSIEGVYQALRGEYVLIAETPIARATRESARQ